MATALLFLGGAALAASAAGGLAGKRPIVVAMPDLVIDSVVLEKAMNPVGEPEGKGGSATSGYDVYTVTYKNIGKAPVPVQFGLLVESSPSPYMTWGGGDPVMYLVNNGGAVGSGWAGDAENLGLSPAQQLGKGSYFIKITSATGDSTVFPNLNKYKLDAGSVGAPLDGSSGGFVKPDNVGQVKVYVSKFYQEMLGSGAARFKFVIDYAPKSTTGQIKESDEKNNAKSMQFDKSQYNLAPTDLCESIDPALGSDICKNAGGSFICIDKYTQWYSSCVKEAAECGAVVKTLVPCGVYGTPTSTPPGPATSTPPTSPTSTPPATAAQPAIESLAISSPAWPAIIINQSKTQGGLPEYPDSIWLSWSGPTLVMLHTNAINTDANTEYAFHVIYDGSMNVNYLFGSQLKWSKSPDFTFSTNSTYSFTIYTFVRNGDNISIVSPMIDDYTYKTILKKYDPPTPANPTSSPTSS